MRYRPWIVTDFAHLIHGEFGAYLVPNRAAQSIDGSKETR